MSYKTAEYNFTLSPKPTELPNVVVNSTPIRQKGDTLNYVVSALGDQKVVENTHSQDGMMRNYNNIICEYPMDKIIWGGAKNRFRFVLEIFEEKLHASEVGPL